MVCTACLHPVFGSGDRLRRLEVSERARSVVGIRSSCLSGQTSLLRLTLPVPVRVLFLCEQGVLTRDVLSGSPARRTCYTVSCTKDFGSDSFEHHA